ncbi:DNA polymerase III subunit gamma/tau [Schleiferilactobacillus shenzhenensis]|uniref:DNA-directed DNA polymerase n=1 Tax=Schleiferilactobacillus shenzhenensis LY-73 TaxID=1231336 RepID=U4TS75_9LACO|nr:DNA polymerase III subunit gamma/tau [Schleiferilactobacillus shenzhenensis]ERL66300.1 DnaX [Schleiferilactobacillus shenzhenensis LY-73]
MAYQALYRVWRPQRFADLVGQETITQTLKNALITDQISHAYLFTGPRGTGKTSAAKILAKAVNCRFRKDGEPCNQCDTCKAITAGSLGDVIEIDAASNNGVDEIRDIRDKAKYPPTVADYKVYIIDEVHMLSTGAFNALLKTLEEPPAHVIFILATTEIQKVPATIISRTQRFDFKRIASETIVDRMQYILKDMKITYDDAALELIANAAAGGMRDALSILDQVLSYGDDHVTLANALSVTGSLSGDTLTKYLQAVDQGDTAQGLTIVQQELAVGKDPNQFIVNLLVFLRDLLLYRQDPHLARSFYATQDPDTFARLVKEINDTKIYRMIDVLTAVQDQLRQTTHPDVYLDVLTVKLATLDTTVVATQPANPAGAQAAPAAPALTHTIKSLEQQVAALQQQVQQGSGAAPAPTPAQRPAPAAPAAVKTKVRVNLEEINAVLGTATRQSLEAIRGLWDELLSMLSVSQRAVLHVGAEPVAASPDAVVVSFDYPLMFERAAKDQVMRQQVEADLAKLANHAIAVYFVPKEQWPRIRQDYLAAHPIGKKRRRSAPPASAAAAPTSADATDSAAEETPPVISDSDAAAMSDAGGTASPGKRPPDSQSAVAADSQTATEDAAASPEEAAPAPTGADLVAKAKALFGDFVEVDSGQPQTEHEHKQDDPQNNPTDGVNANG